MVLDVLGRGAMAVVYAVRHLSLGTVHALKVLQLPTPVIRDRLLREGQIQGSLRHPNVVAVTDSVEVDGHTGLVLELVRGPSLDHLLREVPLTMDQRLALGAHVLLGVQAAHREGHVHRDLKPANVLVDAVDGRLVAKVADFGLAKALQSDDASAHATRTGTTLGTPAYMAPEQLRRARAVDGRADVFSLGALLYEVVTGARAFPGDDLMDVFDAIRAGQYRPIAELADVPDTVARAIERALEPDLDRRTSSVDALLRAWTEGRSVEVVPWAADLVDRARALGTQVTSSQGGGASSTYGDTVHPAHAPSPPAAVVRWEPTLNEGGATSRVGLTLVGVGFGAVTLLVFAGAAVAAVVAALLFLDRGSADPSVDPAPDAVVAEAPPDPALVSGRWDLVVKDSALGVPGQFDDQCADPGPCLARAAASLWRGDGDAWAWLELADAQPRPRAPHHRTAKHIGEVVRAVDPDGDREDRVFDRATDDLVALAVLAQLPGVEPGRRLAALDAYLETHGGEVGARLLRDRLWAAGGRRSDARADLDAILVDQPGHAPALGLAGELALAEGDAAGALELVTRVPDGPDTLRVKAAALRSLGTTELAPPAEGAAAFELGVAEAAFGLGFHADARAHLAAAMEASRPLQRGPAVWAWSDMALLDGDPRALEDASVALRKLAADRVAPVESTRLNNRADLLDGLRALGARDAALLAEARRGLEGRAGGRRIAALLTALSVAQGRGEPQAVLDGGCEFRLLFARALDDVGAARAPEALRALAEGDVCGRFGSERLARAEAWVRLAGRAHAAGTDAEARAALAEYEGLVPGIEHAFYERAGTLAGDLAVGEP